MLLQGLYVSDFWPLRLHTERKRPSTHSPTPTSTLKSKNLQSNEPCLKKEVVAEVGRRTVMQKIWLKLLHSEEDRESPLHEAIQTQGLF
ncbi:mCG146887 [Mus musculus]|jgi:hypothetical protein|nr:mCG146887 [Mus musculus]